MAYSKSNYKLLKEIGKFTAKVANVLSRRSDINVLFQIEDNVLRLLEDGYKFSSKDKYKILRLFGYSSKDSQVFRAFGKQNFYNILLQKAVPKAYDLAQDRIIDIKLLSAFSAGRYQQKKYLYEVEYYVDTGFVSTRKYVTVTSNNKLTKQQVHNHIVDTQFPKHEDDYESVPIESTIKIMKAYYITADEKKKITAKRDADYDAKKNTSHNKSRQSQ
jgi:hypothetical protein